MTPRERAGAILDRWNLDCATINRTAIGASEFVDRIEEAIIAAVTESKIQQQDSRGDAIAVWSLIADLRESEERLRWEMSHSLTFWEKVELREKAAMFDWLASHIRKSVHGEFYILPIDVLRFPAESAIDAIKKAFEMRIVTVEHAGKSYVFNPADVSKAEVIYEADASANNQINYIYDLSGAHRGEPMRVIACKIEEEHDEDGRRLTFAHLEWADDRTRIESADICDAYTDQIIDDMREGWR